MRSPLLGSGPDVRDTDRFSLVDRAVLHVRLDGDVLARQGSVVAQQGELTSTPEGPGGVGRYLRRALTGEGLPLVRVSGHGDLYLAHEAADVHLVVLEGDSLTVGSRNVLAFEPSLAWDVRRLEGASAVAGGLAAAVLTGHGTLALTSSGPPLVLTVDRPTAVDVHAAIAWSSTLRARVRSSVTPGALVGRGSGEAFQVVFEGDGVVVVQPGERRPAVTGPVL